MERMRPERTKGRKEERKKDRQTLMSGRLRYASPRENVPAISRVVSCDSNLTCDGRRAMTLSTSEGSTCSILLKDMDQYGTERSSGETMCPFEPPKRN